mmetsp:Transcript_14653/g.55412  ORF Transcript_14653/g.55412 Transcript_14653/m.55412 type:complete len:264 (-) Transcript_14653:717-1508(-)
MAWRIVFVSSFTFFSSPTSLMFRSFLMGASSDSRLSMDSLGRHFSNCSYHAWRFFISPASFLLASSRASSSTLSRLYDSMLEKNISALNIRHTWKRENRLSAAGSSSFSASSSSSLGGRIARLFLTVSQRSSLLLLVLFFSAPAQTPPAMPIPYPDDIARRTDTSPSNCNCLLLRAQRTVCASARERRTTMPSGCTPFARSMHTRTTFSLTCAPSSTSASWTGSPAKSRLERTPSGISESFAALSDLTGTNSFNAKKGASTPA